MAQAPKQDDPLLVAVLADFQSVGQDLWSSSLISSHGGNMSIRVDNTVIITRHGSMLGHLDGNDLTPLAVGSQDGQPEPSMDTPIHQAIYATTQAGAVIHAHPRYAIALSLLGERIEPLDLEGKYHLGLVPVVKDAQEIASALRQYKIVMLAGHGSYARGDDLWQALQWTSVLEESAQVLYLHRTLTAG